MKQIVVFLFCVLCTSIVTAAIKDSVKRYDLPDSLRANGVVARMYVQTVTTRKEVKAGIAAGQVQLYVEADKKETEVVFRYPAGAELIVKGIGVEAEKNELDWDTDAATVKDAQLYIATAGDSALNFRLYSGYIYIAAQQKWKLIGTCRVKGEWKQLNGTETILHTTKKQKEVIGINDLWVQRGNGLLKELTDGKQKAPVLMPFSDVDSVQQAALDEILIQAAIANKTTDATAKATDVYYNIMKEGTGRNVLLTDTVTVFYKGYLFSDGSVFDQTKEKPATFPLNRLIRGWQLAVPYCKVGGKIKIVIPSGLAYSIRTRSPKIPPNSLLVFEVEVVDVKPKQ
jgi:FKBP-type peptidyl-prolyl cis-trans isomerase FkpA